eukprot:3314923-Amphidinium_carterae.1
MDSLFWDENSQRVIVGQDVVLREAVQLSILREHATLDVLPHSRRRHESQGRTPLPRRKVRAGSVDALLAEQKARWSQETTSVELLETWRKSNGVAGAIGVSSHSP